MLRLAVMMMVVMSVCDDVCLWCVVEVLISCGLLVAGLTATWRSVVKECLSSSDEGQSITFLFVCGRMKDHPAGLD